MKSFITAHIGYHRTLKLGELRRYRFQESCPLYNFLNFNSLHIGFEPTSFDILYSFLFQLSNELSLDKHKIKNPFYMKQFSFDFSYWSVSEKDPHYAKEEQASCLYSK